MNLQSLEFQAAIPVFVVSDRMNLCKLDIALQAEVYLEKNVTEKGDVKKIAGG